MIGYPHRQWLLATCAGPVAFDEPMSRHTYFKVGGPADALVRPRGRDEAVAVMKGTAERGIPLTILGKGSNILVRDNGIRGIVLKMDRGALHLGPRQGETRIIRADAGAGLQSLCRYAIEAGLAGLNFALGIPGSVGGSVAMNANTGLGSMADVLERIAVLQPNLALAVIEKKDLDFRYRQLAWQAPPLPHQTPRPLILAAEFRLRMGKIEALRAEAEEVLLRRNQTQPIHLPSAGCFFKNPIEGPPAGRLIDQAGLKGVRVGDAQVSERHANFLVNTGHASAADVLNLMALVQEKVLAAFQIRLEPEVKIVG